MHVRDIFKILASSKKTPSKSNNKSKSKPSVVPTIDSKDVLQLAYKSKENIIQFPVKCDNPDDAIRLWNLAIQSPEDSFNLRLMAIGCLLISLFEPYDTDTHLRLYEMCIKTIKCGENNSNANSASCLWEMARRWEHMAFVDKGLMNTRQIEQFESTLTHAKILEIQEICFQKDDTSALSNDVNTKVSIIMRDALHGLHTPMAGMKFVDELMQFITENLMEKRQDWLMIKYLLNELLQSTDKTTVQSILADYPSKLQSLHVLLVESLLMLGELSQAMKWSELSLSINPSHIPSIMGKLKCLLAKHPEESVDEEALTELCAHVPLLGSLSVELFQMICVKCGPALAFDCIQAASQRHDLIQEPLLNVRVILLKTGVVCSDQGLSDDQRIEFVQSLLTEIPNDESGEQSSDLIYSLVSLIGQQADRCTLAGDHSHALKWILLVNQLNKNEESSTARLTQPKLVNCLLATGLIEEAEKEVLKVEPGSIQGCLLRFQLAMHQNRRADAIALVTQLATKESKVTRVLSLLEYCRNDILVMIQVLKSACDMQLAKDNNGLIDSRPLRSLLSLLAAMDDEKDSSFIKVQQDESISLAIDPRHKITLATKYVPFFQPCDQSEEVQFLKICWNLGQMAVRSEMHHEARTLFNYPLTMHSMASADRMACHFFRLQSNVILLSQKELYTELIEEITQDLDVLTQQQSTKPVTTLNKKRRTSEIDAILPPLQVESLQDKLSQYKVTLWVHTGQWNHLEAELKRVRELKPISSNPALIESIVSTVIRAQGVPYSVSLVCLDLLVSIEEERQSFVEGSNDTTKRFASLYRGLCTTALLTDSQTALTYFKKALKFISSKSSSWPRDELLWLCVTSFNTAILHHSWTSDNDHNAPSNTRPALAQSWCEVSIALLLHLHPDDRAVYETRIRNGYTRILTTNPKQTV